MRKIFIYSLVFFASISASYAQVFLQDSLALVSLYNNTAGSSWTNKTNWLTGPVSSWHGVVLNGIRVEYLSLSNNNLSGSIPSEICDLTQLKTLSLRGNDLIGTIPGCIGNFGLLNTLDVRNNNLSGSIPSSITSCINLGDLLISDNQFDQLPSLMSIPEITNIYIENNRFTFEDIEPNIDLFNFTYSPQDSIHFSTDTIVNRSDTASFFVSAEGDFNLYQWFFNGSPLSNSSHIVGADSAVLTINKSILSDSGTYFCRVTNSLVGGLTLIRRPILVNVIDNRLNQELFFIPRPPIYCGENAFTINAITTYGLPITYTLVSGLANLNVDVIQPLAPGNIFVTAFNLGNDDYKPVSKDTTFVILNPQVNAVILTNNMPVSEGDTLQLSASLNSGSNYQWTSPSGMLFDSNKVVISQVTKNEEGYFKITIDTNACRYFYDSIFVVINEAVAKEIFVYELVSPNGDNKNETFYIYNIEEYHDSEVVIYNTWGQILFEKSGYDNSWNGEGFPAGTYYYSISIPSIDYKSKGSFYLSK